MSLGRRRFLAAIAGGLLAAPLGAEAQPPKVPQIGVLSPGSPGPSPLIGAFQQGLRDLGYLDRQSVVIEYRFAEAKLERLPALAAELVNLKVDVILAINTPAVLAAKNATKTIPIVFTWVGDPAGVVASLARPEGNVTGLATLATDLSGKRLGLLKETLPGLSRVVVLWNLDAPANKLQAEELQHTGPQLGLQVQLLGVRSPDEYENALRAATRQQAGALFVTEEAMLLPYRRRLLDLAAKHRLPAASGYREFAEAGGLLTYGPQLPDLFRRAAIYVDKILKGTKPRDLPVERPTKFELVINLKTARALGLTIPQAFLARADEVIQ